MKKLFVKVSAWLRSIVPTMLKREKKKVKSSIVSSEVQYGQTSFGSQSSPVAPDNLMLRMEAFVNDHYEVRLNRRYLLHDETGSRRFICVELIHAIDVDTPLDYEQLYAEAMAALAAGERCWFDEEETRQLEAHNAAYSVRCGVWDLLRQYFEVCEVLEEADSADEKAESLWSAAEVYDFLHEISAAALEGIDRHNFGYYLKQMGAPGVRVGNRRMYGVALRGAA